MYKVLINGLAALGTIFFITSCDSNQKDDTALEDLNQPVCCVLKRASANECVSLSTAEKVADRFLTAGRKSRTGRSIGESFTVNDSEGNPTCYVINYADNAGFVIVSATKDVEPILAYSETGNFTSEVMEKTGASIIMGENKYLIEHSEQLPESIKIANRINWEQLDYEEEIVQLESSRSYDDVYHVYMSQLNEWRAAMYEYWELAEFKKTTMFASMSEEDKDAITKLPYGNANRDYFGGVEHTTFVVYKDHANTLGYVTSEWGQYWPYNIYAPNKASLGSATIAAGQIMYYHKYPTTIRWSEMPKNATQSTPITAAFLYELAQKIGVNFDYGSTASLTGVQKAFNSYGYSCSIIPHSAVKVQNEILQSRPVYMRGVEKDTEITHDWTCDGYQRSNAYSQYELWCLEDCPSGYEPTQFYCIYSWGERYAPAWEKYLMNWGSDGKNNGWFSDNEFNEFIGSFSQGRTDIIGIQHK